jgi:DNA polymerase-3 subunit gamma/tau
MSYQVLARKWRPQTFSELVGQQHVVDAITNALENDKLHHAYLFTGTRGVGKTTIARIFSKSLNCERGQSANPCGVCDTCKDISDGRFVDLLEIDAASRTKVEDTRELLDNVQYKPTRGKYKVYLIDEVHMLSKHSFNALLKTLEEPPEHVKFLLATTDPQKLPVTILSRCLQFSLKALSREQIQTQLSHILTDEKITFEETALSQLARAAAGSMRDALSLTDQAIAQGNDRVMLDTVISMLGLLDKNQVLRLAKFIAERDGEKAMAQLDELCADSPDYAQVLSQLLSLLHQIALTQIVPDICKLDTNSAKPIYTLSKAISSEHIQLMYQIALNGKRDLPFAPDPLTGLQMTVMRMLAFSPTQSIPLDTDSLAVSEKPELTSASEHSEMEQVIPSNVESVVTEDTQSETLALNEEVGSNNSIAEEPIPDISDGGAPQIASDNNKVADIDGSGVIDDGYRPQDHDHSDEQMFAPQDDIGSARDNSYLDESSVESMPPASSEDEDDSDSVARLQSLFDMEDDLQSYEQQMEEQDKGKKSELDESSLGNSVGTVGRQQVQDDSKENSTHSSAAAASTSAAEVAIVRDDISTELADVPSDFNDLAPVASVFSQSTLGNIKPTLDNGQKLQLASQIDEWSAFVDALDARGLARQLLIHGRSQGVKDDQLTVEINQTHHHLNEESSLQSIRDALKQKYQRVINVVVEYGNVKNSPYELQLQIDAMRLEHAKNVISTDSSIQELLKAFDASVIENSIEAR